MRARVLHVPTHTRVLSYNTGLMSLSCGRGSRQDLLLHPGRASSVQVRQPRLSSAFVVSAKGETQVHGHSRDSKSSAVSAGDATFVELAQQDLWSRAPAPAGQVLSVHVNAALGPEVVNDLKQNQVLPNLVLPASNFQGRDGGRSLPVETALASAHSTIPEWPLGLTSSSGSASPIFPWSHVRGFNNRSWSFQAEGQQIEEEQVSTVPTKRTDPQFSCSRNLD